MVQLPSTVKELNGEEKEEGMPRGKTAKESEKGNQEKCCAIVMRLEARRLKTKEESRGQRPPPSSTTIGCPNTSRRMSSGEEVVVEECCCMDLGGMWITYGCCLSLGGILVGPGRMVGLMGGPVRHSSHLSSNPRGRARPPRTMRGTLRGMSRDV
eukprot:Gb_32580 [translate_table: standard]